MPTKTYNLERKYRLLQIFNVVSHVFCILFFGYFIVTFLLYKYSSAFFEEHRDVADLSLFAVIGSGFFFVYMPDGIAKNIVKALGSGEAVATIDNLDMLLHLSVLSGFGSIQQIVREILEQASSSEIHSLSEPIKRRLGKLSKHRRYSRFIPQSVVDTLVER